MGLNAAGGGGNVCVFSGIYGGELTLFRLNCAGW
jgi:hypothetical protein